MDTPVIVALIGVFGSAIVAALNQHLAGRVRLQQKELAWIKTALRLMLSDYERAHLQAFASVSPFMADIRKNSSFEWELRHLVTLDLIKRRTDKGFGTLFAQDGKRDAKEHFYITDRGHEYLRVFDEAKK